MRKFSTFEGVFTPCLLSILGVIMYLRLGWVVGTVGLAGTLIIIVLSNLITLSTTLSMSSVVTNIRIGAGGAYSIISKSLGIEAGGAIGIPLYISQAISVAFYIAGFAECWQFLFSDHDPLLVSIILWAVLLIVTYVSAKFAFRLQYLIMAIIGLSIVAIFLGNSNYPAITIKPWDNFSGDNFWYAFAIFFPAVTGILAGASMSGELAEPRHAIPKGTLWAIGVSFVIYAALAIFFATHVSANELMVNNSIAIELGRWQWVVIMGILGATLSSALGMLVAAPRVLLALGKHRVVPLGGSFKRVNEKGEPTTAILFTALITLVTILYGSLDQIAGLLTMFFMITYGMINLTVLIEQSMGIISFRPTFRVSRWVSFLGALGCLSVMFILDMRFGLIALLIIAATYWILLRKQESLYSPDIRSGMLIYLAEVFAKAASKLPYYPKIWKPNFLVPVSDLKKFDEAIPLIKSIVEPSGRVTAFSIVSPFASIVNEREKLAQSVKRLREDNIFVETTVMQHRDFLEGCKGVMQVIEGMFFPPNTLFYFIDEDEEKDTQTTSILSRASEDGLGLILLEYDHRVGLGKEEMVNLWIRQQSPNIDLSVLMALQLQRNWRGKLRIVQVVYNAHEKAEAIAYLNRMKEIMRMPLDVEIEVIVGRFEDALTQAPVADINIFGMQEVQDITMVRRVAGLCRTSVLFLRDSKHESALA